MEAKAGGREWRNVKLRRSEGERERERERERVAGESSDRGEK